MGLPMGRMWREEGFTLLETVLALGILGLIGVGFIAAMTTGTKATGTLDNHVTAEAAARSQLDIIKSDPEYRSNCGYTAITPPSGFTVALQCQDISGGGNTLQKITVSVSLTAGGKPVFNLTTYKKKP